VEIGIVLAAQAAKVVTIAVVLSAIIAEHVFVFL
jgi:hypothetical protein